MVVDVTVSSAYSPDSDSWADLDGFCRIPDRQVSQISHVVASSGLDYRGLNEVRQRKRVYHRTLAGLKRNKFLKRSLRFLTLTTQVGYDFKRLSRDFNVFCKRLEHVNVEQDQFNAFKIEYVKVTTDEGNGVIHCIFYGSIVKKCRQVTLDNLPRRHCRKGGSPVRNSNLEVGFIPFDWLKRTWAEVVGGDARTQHVHIQRVYGSEAKIAGYLCQYVAGQNKLERCSYTNHWVYRGFVGDWNEGFVPRIAELYRVGEPSDEALEAVYREWDNRICSRFLNS